MCLRNIIVFLFFSLPLTAVAGPVEQDAIRIAVVSSYHPEYVWSQGTSDGLTAGLLEFGYLDNREQIDRFTQTNQVASSKAHIRKYWMDTKHKTSEEEIADSFARISGELEGFSPDIVLLGDDNAANFFGNYYLDTGTPVVFWGVNGTPLKYGLLDSIERPGHNVTGIYQHSYYRENLQLLQRLVPNAKRVAILSDDSATGRAHSKMFRKAVEEGDLGLELVGAVATNSFEHWKEQALDLSAQVDAFLISTNYTLKAADGTPVAQDDLARWYLQNIRKPEVVAPFNYVNVGMLACVFDSPFKQGYETARVMHRIISGGEQPATIAAYAPDHGGYVVNRWRAGELGLGTGIDESDAAFHEFVDKHVALD